MLYLRLKSISEQTLNHQGWIFVRPANAVSGKDAHGPPGG